VDFPTFGNPTIPALSIPLKDISRPRNARRLEDVFIAKPMFGNMRKPGLIKRIGLTVLLAGMLDAGGSAHVKLGPWGHLTASPIVIAPPIEYIPRESGPPQPTQWHFPNTSLERLEQLLTQCGLAPALVARLVGMAQHEPAAKGLAIRPPDDVVRTLPADARGKLYLELAHSPLNFDQNAAYFYRAGTIDTWLGGPEITPPEIRKIVDPLVYRIGEFLYLADIEQVRARTGSTPEFFNLVRRLLRQQTMFVAISIASTDDIDKLEEYWGRGGRRTDIRPVLESIADGQENVKISELLPDLPRRLLYRFPKVRVADQEKGELANCFWTALNFFNDTPDDRYLDGRVALDTLKRDYFLVHGGMQLGDIAVFTGSDGSVAHVAVYLADDLLFTKNGSFSLAPWIILPIDQLRGRYAGQFDDWTITYYRRKDL
jgi:hypothetical protein